MSAKTGWLRRRVPGWLRRRVLRSAAQRPVRTPAQSAGTQSRATWLALLAFECVVGASSFALTFHGLYGFGRELAQLGKISACVPVAIDGATLAAIAATFLLAYAPLRVRTYAWLVFGFTNALSVAGNVAYADHHRLPWEGAVAAAAWPLLVTLIAHLGIVTWRHSRLSATLQPRPAASSPAPAPTPPAGPPPVKPRPEPKAIERTPVKAAQPAPDKVAAVQRVISGGESMRAVARSIGCSDGAIRNWVREVQAADTGNGHTSNN